MNKLYTTKKGRETLAKAVTSGKLTLSKVEVGKGIYNESLNAEVFEHLITVVGEATSSIPETSGNAITFTLEYRNDLNGGLKEGFFISEFGVFALDEDLGEVLLLYGSLESPQWISAESSSILDVRRYPISIAIEGDILAETTYVPSAFLIPEDLTTHNTSDTAHENRFHPRIQLAVQETLPLEQGVFLWVDTPPKEETFIYPAT